jgi:hypothetical protein
MPARVKLKGIDGGPHKRWSMWFNSMIREEPYLGLTCRGKAPRSAPVEIRPCAGAAWLSSARAVRCWVKSRNERNPYCQLLTGKAWGLWRNCRWQTGGRWGWRQVIMALMSRATHVLQWAVQSGAKPRGASESLKAARSSDWSLKPDFMKLESLVIAHQHGAVNTFPGLVHTARHTIRVGGTRSR